MRSGDTVRHIPTGERWIVAYVDGGYLSWCGWPDGRVPVEECALVEACSDAEHEAMLRNWTDRPHRRDDGSDDRRAVVCRRQLAEWTTRGGTR